jgi:hypothetical protein
MSEYEVVGIEAVKNGRIMRVSTIKMVVVLFLYALILNVG